MLGGILHKFHFHSLFKAVQFDLFGAKKSEKSYGGNVIFKGF